jgi:hypothetical protein
VGAVPAAVHALRVGQTPCRLCVALPRDQRWNVITQEDGLKLERFAIFEPFLGGPCALRRGGAKTLTNRSLDRRKGRSPLEKGTGPCRS